MPYFNKHEFDLSQKRDLNLRSSDFSETLLQEADDTLSNRWLQAAERLDFDQIAE
jgi:hypothetical protein